MVPKNIVAIGAGTCEGQADSQGNGFVGRLRVWHEGVDEHNHVYNLGISGETSEGLLNRLASEAKPRNPGLIIVHLGLNDLIREGGREASPLLQPEDYKNNIRRIIIRAQSFGEVVFISLLPVDETKTAPVSWQNLYYLLADIKVFTQTIQEVCAEMQIEYIDIFNDWIQQNYTQYIHVDGLCINGQGHQYIFDKLKIRLEQLFGQ
ncbi:GDSL-type esterase/lipase family protein [Patescibacteria group bacterium]